MEQLEEIYNTMHELQEIEKLQELQEELQEECYQVIYQLYIRKTSKLINACSVEYCGFKGQVQTDENGLVFQQYFNEFLKDKRDADYDPEIYYRVVQVWKCGIDYYNNRRSIEDKLIEEEVDKKFKEITGDEVLLEKFKNYKI